MKKTQIILLLAISFVFLGQQLNGQKVDKDLHEGKSQVGGEPPQQGGDQPEPLLLEKLLEICEEAKEQTNSLIDGIRPDRRIIQLAIAGNENWNVYLMFSSNQKYAFVVFPCNTVDMSDSTLIRRLLEENTNLALSRFEILNGRLRICTPCEMSELTASKLNKMVENNISVARGTAKIWGGQLAKTEKTPNQKSSKESSEPSTEESLELTKICVDQELRIGTIEITSVNNMNYVGPISFTSDMTFSMKAQDIPNDHEISLQGTYKIMFGQLHLIVVKPGSNEEVRFTYDLISENEEKTVLKSENGRLDTITFEAK